ncbi:unnamed protein product [Dicrocoelium dendriticum]|nr:unnamed protein product [Dicrocoelium dendriticum]
MEPGHLLSPGHSALRNPTLETHSYSGPIRHTRPTHIAKPPSGGRLGLGTTTQAAAGLVQTHIGGRTPASKLVEAPLKTGRCSLRRPAHPAHPSTPTQRPHTPTLVTLPILLPLTPPPPFQRDHARGPLGP